MDFTRFGFVETWAAAFAAVFGGIGVKVIEKLLSKRSEEFRENLRLREELRAENTSLRKQLDAQKIETADWREKYYERAEENLGLKASLETLRSEFESYKHRNPSENPES
jgi:chromosome segregation ATPase